MRSSINILLAIAFAINGLAATPYVIVLGVGPDAGVPHMGCESLFCRLAWKDSKLRRTVSSIALVDRDTKSRWIFEATPDLPEQFELLKQITRRRSNDVNGIFFTHAHIGHDLVKASDFLLLDGTFYADGEIPRPMGEVPHPFVSETINLLKSTTAKNRAKVYFIHFNHSNPLVQGNASRIREARSPGFRIASIGLRLDL